MSLNKAQKEAVEYLDGPLLVLAGPGTGKTHLLSAKVKYILENTDTNPENILCVTFTDPATANIRERLLSKVGPAARKVNIHTYHAFGADLLAQYKNYSDSYPRALDDVVDDVAKYKIIKNIQEKLPALDILKTAAISDITNTIGSAKSARLRPEQLLKIADENMRLTAELNSEITEVMQNFKKGMKLDYALETIYQPLLDIFVKHSSREPLIPSIDGVGDIEPEANFLARELNLVIENAKAAEKPSISPLSKWKDRTIELDSNGGYRLHNIISNKKLRSLAHIYTVYQEELEKNGLYDFEDMIGEAIRFLREDQGFRLSLSERYQYILLDEFQDTNPSQFELIRLLTDYEKPCVMAVGDDDQAIYSFQGAESSNLLDFQSYYNAKVVNLTENYRSTSEVLALSRQIADQITDSFAKKHHVDKTLVSTRNEELLSKNHNDTNITRHEFISSDAEYYWVAERIANLVKSGEKQSDIAIICPKHKYILPLLPYLKSHKNLNIAYEKRENILEDSKIHQLLTLSDFIIRLANSKPTSHQLLEILSFPFWGISPLTAINAISAARNDKKQALDYLTNSEDERLKTLANFLAALVAKSFDTPLELMLDYMVGTAAIDDSFRSPFLEYYAKDDTSYETFSLYENLNILKSTLKNYLKGQPLKLQDLVNLVADYQAAGVAILNTSPYQDDSDAIQILTAHKSKGLEFKHVFLIATDSLSWGSGGGNNNKLVLPRNLTHIRHTGATEDERLRLFFVALTRAKLSLTLTNSIKDFAGKSPDRLEYLSEHIDDDTGILASPLMPDQIVHTHYEDLEEAKLKTDLRKTWVSAYSKLTSELKPLLLKRLENYQLTATDLTTFIDIAYAGPLEFYKRKVLKAPAEPADTSLEFGNLVHATFEQVTKAKLDDDAAIKYYQDQVALIPATATELSELTEKGTFALSVSLKSFGDLLRAENAKAEVDFFHEHLSAGPIPITGKIDHISVDSSTKTIEIYDFKTGGFHKEGWGSHPTLYKYALQLEFYKLLLQNSPAYHNYEIKQGHILFVTPDGAGEVHDKIYKFTAKGSAETLELMTAVYSHMKTLDFLENPKLAVKPDPENNLKKIKEFVDLVIETAPALDNKAI
ncbi:ATP-dependent helicase [Candidatus Saccharibacteria bacterium]|nr:ATP-dependent helicase [Candidatus Saccharibacteria bacterium]